MPGQLPHREDGAVQPGDVRETEQARARGDFGLDRRKDLGCPEIADRHDPKRGAGRDEPAEEAGVLRVRRHHLVARPDAQAAQDDVAAFRRRGRERDLFRLRAQEACKLAPQRLALLQRALEVRTARAALLQLEALDGLHRLDRRPRQRAERARVQVRIALQHRQAAADGYEVDAITASTGAWSERTASPSRCRASGHACGPRSSSKPRTRI